MKTNAAISKRTGVCRQHFPVVVLLAKAKDVHRSNTLVVYSSDGGKLTAWETEKHSGTIAGRLFTFQR
jgi:hypothetical protein